MSYPHESRAAAKRTAPQIRISSKQLLSYPDPNNVELPAEATGSKLRCIADKDQQRAGRGGPSGSARP